MPVTAFHMAPALVAKAPARQYVSVRIFALVQIIIDLESATSLLLRADVTHRHLHTLVGASVIGLLAAAVGRSAFNTLNVSTQLLLGRITGMPAWVVAEVQWIPWPAALFSGIFGAMSHVALDAVIHSDVHPFWPFSPWNPFLIAGTFTIMHYECAAVGSMGLVCWLALARRYPRGEPQ